VGAIGLGIGSIACYQSPGQAWSFFEIDPLVARIARDETYFHFMSRCGQNARMVFGDGRLSLAREPDGGFDLLVVDAFSSDAIPMHLMTKEAMDLYWRKLSPHGLLAIHISNRHLDLAPVLANIAKAAGLVGRIQYHTPAPELASAKFHTDSIWTIIARSDGDLARLNDNEAWTRLLPDARAPLWTDDFSNLIGVIKR
jgi:spermidine synthase